VSPTMWLFTSLPCKAQNTHLNVIVRDQPVSEKRGTELNGKMKGPNYGSTSREEL